MYLTLRMWTIRSSLRPTRREFPREEVSARYIEECKKDMEAMNVRPATVHPQATHEIQGMIDMNPGP